MSFNLSEKTTHLHKIIEKITNVIIDACKESEEMNGMDIDYNKIEVILSSIIKDSFREYLKENIKINPIVARLGLPRAEQWVENTLCTECGSEINIREGPIIKLSRGYLYEDGYHPSQDLAFFHQDCVRSFYTNYIIPPLTVDKNSERNLLIKINDNLW